MFATDTDLLALEPNLFRDVSWTGQRLLAGLGVISASVLTISSYDNSFTTAAVGAGHVVVVGGTPYEVVSVIDATHATISRLRAGPDSATIPPADNTTPAPMLISTFAPQIAIVHRQVLRMIGIEPGQAGTPGCPGESDITNTRDLARLEALGAFHLIYSAAGSLTPQSSPLNQRADFYRQRFARERERIGAEIDLNADGKPDARRMLNVVQFIRS